jgi:ABC-type sugar transport system substrate-binding protein
MRRLIALSLLAAACPALGGCLPMMAVSAASMAARGAEGTPVSNEALQPQARDACTQQAAKYGTVTIIDAEQHRSDQIIVWGTVGEGLQKRSFECDYGTKITGFKLREIHPQQ